jgi:hypothetical protein
VANPENVDAIHSMIRNNQKLSAKRIAGTLAISRERVGYIIHEILDMRTFSAKWVPKCLSADQKCLLQKPFWTDFGGILWDILTVS